MAKIVLFIDALEPREYSGAFTQTERGMVNSGYPHVTPKVTAEVYSGLSPSQQGMGRVHSHFGENPHRPHAVTIQERLEKEGYEILSLNMPYCLPLQLQNEAWISTARGETAYGENQFAQRAEIPPARGNLMNDDKEEAFNIKMESVFARISNALVSLESAKFDVLFLGIRDPDHYTHFQWHESYRQQMLGHIANEIERMAVNHEVLWWSDHGSEEKKETFRINRWLDENDYLDLSVDLEFNQRFEEEMEERNPHAAGMGDDMSIENQLTVGAPGVDLNSGSEVINSDPYDASLNFLTDDVDKEALADDLMDTGYFADVVYPEDVWGEGPFLEDCPDMIPVRGDNVLVTGNVHPEPIGLGYYRSGVHSKQGAWGTTDESFMPEGDVSPRELHDVIFQFVTGDAIDMASVETEEDVADATNPQ